MHLRHLCISELSLEMNHSILWVTVAVLYPGILTWNMLIMSHYYKKLTSAYVCLILQLLKHVQSFMRWLCLTEVSLWPSHCADRSVRRNEVLQSGNENKWFKQMCKSKQLTSSHCWAVRYENGSVFLVIGVICFVLNLRSESVTNSLSHCRWQREKGFAKTVW